MALDLKAAFAEFLALFIFVFICVGVATGVAKQEAIVLQISLTFGLCITVLAYTVGHRSGAQVNCAVTFGLVLQGTLSVMQGLVNLAAQLLGSVCGAALLAAVKTAGNDNTGGFGNNKVAANHEWYEALIGEIFCTFLLMYVVLETAVSKDSEGNRMMAAVPIGLAVFLGHMFLIPITGCSINPTRSFGPLIIGSMGRLGDETGDYWADMWIFWVGPLAGAALGVGVFMLMDRKPAMEAGATSSDMEMTKDVEA